MPWFEESCECEWVVCKLCTPPIAIIGLKLIRLVGIVPVAGLAQGTAPAAEVPAGIQSPEGTDPARCTVRAGVVLWVLGTGRAEVPAGTVRVRGIGRPWAGRGIGPVGIVRPGAGPSYGCS